MLSPKQARRMVAKSRRRVWRLARQITSKRWLACAVASMGNDPHAIPHTRTSRARLTCHWLSAYCHTDAQRLAVRNALRELDRRIQGYFYAKSL